jgi:hypothetical protein
MWSTMYVGLICKGVHLKFNPLQPDQPQHDCPTAHVIGLQYSYDTFSSLHLHSHKKKFIALLKKIVILLLFLENYVSL